MTRGPPIESNVGQGANSIPQYVDWKEKSEEIEFRPDSGVLELMNVGRKGTILTSRSTSQVSSSRFLWLQAERVP